MISPLFTTIVLVSGFIWIFMKFTSKNTAQSTDDFLERERLSNSVRKQPLDKLPYINIDLHDFPIPNPAPNESVSEAYEQLKQLASQKIVNLTGITNTDLKMTYGVANLPTLTEYDQNFTSLCRCIYNLGSELSDLNYTQEAIKVLEKGIEYGSDISGNYLLLADLYTESGESEKISELIKNADSIRSLTKEATINKLTEKLKSAGSSFVNDPDGSVSLIGPDNILPEDILDILETVPYKSDDQKQ